MSVDDFERRRETLTEGMAVSRKSLERNRRSPNSMFTGMEGNSLLQELFTFIKSDDIQGLGDFLSQNEDRIAINSCNEYQETGAHFASFLGKYEILRALVNLGADLNAQDANGNTPLHLAAYNGNVRTTKMLVELGASTAQKNYASNTPLHLAASCGHCECCKILIMLGAYLNSVNASGRTPLLEALKEGHETVAKMLIKVGCETNIEDQDSNTALHFAVRDDLVDVADMLCKRGAKTDVFNRFGYSPLHYAAKIGSMDMVRCLCLNGSLINIKNKEGISPEISAYAEKHVNVAELLSKLSNEELREEYIEQLLTRDETLNKVKVKIFGDAGSGKSSLMDSLKYGKTFNIFKWRRSSTSSAGSNLYRYGSSTYERSDKDRQRVNLGRSPGRKSQPEVEGQSYVRRNSWSSEKQQVEHYTKGIYVTTSQSSYQGSFTLYEFSSLPNYFQVYDFFLNDVNSVHLVLFSLELPSELALGSILTWIRFLRSMLPVREFSDDARIEEGYARLALVATHADSAGCCKDPNGKYVSPAADSIFRQVHADFKHVFDIHDRIFIVDSTNSSAMELRELKKYLNNQKVDICKNLPNKTNILERILLLLPSWRKKLVSNPVVEESHLLEIIRRDVNPLVTQKHFSDLLRQLITMGEITNLKTSSTSLVILNPFWICCDVIGYFLSEDFVLKSRINGCYTEDVFHLVYSECESSEMLTLLETIQLCVKYSHDNITEYEFPCYIQLQGDKDLWDIYDNRFQVKLRQWANRANSEEVDLQQWCGVSKISFDCFEILICFVLESNCIEVRIRCPRNRWSEKVFVSYETLLREVEQVRQRNSLLVPISHYKWVEDICPGCIFVWDVISCKDLQHLVKKPYIYSAEEVNSKVYEFGFDATVDNRDQRSTERITSVFGLVNESFMNSIVLFPNIHFRVLSKACLLEFLHLVSKEDSGYQGIVSSLFSKTETKDSTGSVSCCVLSRWSRLLNLRIGHVIKILNQLRYNDAVCYLFQVVPSYRLIKMLDDS